MGEGYFVNYCIALSCSFALFRLCNRRLLRFATAVSLCCSACLCLRKANSSNTGLRILSCSFALNGNSAFCKIVLSTFAKALQPLLTRASRFYPGRNGDCPCRCCHRKIFRYCHRSHRHRHRRLMVLHNTSLRYKFRHL